MLNATFKFNSLPIPNCGATHNEHSLMKGTVPKHLGPVPGGINYTRYNSYSRDKSAVLGITIPGIKTGSRKHYLSLE